MSDCGNLYSLLEARFRAHSDQPAFRVRNGCILSYGELAAMINRYANTLTRLGVRPGDRVALQADKSIANVALYLATLKSGAVLQPLNTAYTPAELDYFIGDAEPALVVVGPDRKEELPAIARRHGVKALETLDDEGNGTLAALAATERSVAETVTRASSDLAGLLYTSGTTGRSKGAMLSHLNLSSNAATLHALWKFAPGDVLLHALPVFHVHGLYVALNTAFLNGSEIIWLPRFDVNEVVRLLPEATVMMGVPTFYTRLLGHDGFRRETCRNMRLFISGSAPLLAETHTAFTERTGHEILERYGMTECGMITSNPYDGRRLAGSVGYALPDVSVRVADETGLAVPPGEVGIIECKGPNVFGGYWRMPDKTVEAFRPDGYFITGDMGVMADDGRITIVGRASDLIISGGFNVYPKEVEAELDQMPGIEESAVIGVNHPDLGEGVVAVVTVENAIAPPGEGEIVAALGQRLARFKIPKRVFLVDELPRNTMGKVQKAVLRKRFADAFSAPRP